MPNIRKLFNICLVALLWIVSGAMLSAVMIPSRVSDPEAAMQIQRTAELYRAGSMTLLWVIWTVFFAAVSIPALVKANSR